MFVDQRTAKKRLNHQVVINMEQTLFKYTVMHSTKQVPGPLSIKISAHFWFFTRGRSERWCMHAINEKNAESGVVRRVWCTCLARGIVKIQYCPPKCSDNRVEADGTDVRFLFEVVPSTFPRKSLFAHLDHLLHWQYKYADYTGENPMLRPGLKLHSYAPLNMIMGLCQGWIARDEE